MKFIFPIITIILFSSCAVRYRSINPNEIPFYNKNENSCVRYSYKYDVLSLRGNKRLSKKENKKYIKVVAVEITNLTGRDINFKNDVQIKLGQTEIMPMEPEMVKAKIHQNVPVYLLYSFLILQKTTYGYYRSYTKTYPIGIPIALGNMIVAGSANKKFLAELKQYDITKETIKSGETKQGIICFNSFGSDPIDISLRNSDCGNSYNLLSNNSNQILDLSSVLYFTTTDSSYMSYINRVQSLLRQDFGILSYEFFVSKNRDGSINCRGIKAKHNYGVNNEYKYKIGTWEYYSKDGKLEKTINYDLKENIVKVINF